MLYTVPFCSASHWSVARKRCSRTSPAVDPRSPAARFVSANPGCGVGCGVAPDCAPVAAALPCAERGAAAAMLLGPRAGVERASVAGPFALALLSLPGVVAVSAGFGAWRAGRAAPAAAVGALLAVCAAGNAVSTSVVTVGTEAGPGGASNVW